MSDPAEGGYKALSVFIVEDLYLPWNLFKWVSPPCVFAAKPKFTPEHCSCIFIYYILFALRFLSENLISSLSPGVFRDLHKLEWLWVAFSPFGLMGISVCDICEQWCFRNYLWMHIDICYSKISASQWKADGRITFRPFGCAAVSGVELITVKSLLYFLLLYFGLTRMLDHNPLSTLSQDTLIGLQSLVYL